MAHGCFVDIRQQDGQSVRMMYPPHQWRVAHWIGANEQLADKFKVAPP